MGTTIAIFLLSAAITLIGVSSMMQARRINELRNVVEHLMLSQISLMKTSTMVQQMVDENRELHKNNH